MPCGAEGGGGGRGGGAGRTGGSGAPGMRPATYPGLLVRWAVAVDLRKQRPTAPPLRVLLARVQYRQSRYLSHAAQHSASDLVPDTSPTLWPYQSRALGLPEGPEHTPKSLL
jgi:hypothetical protein